MKHRKHVHTIHVNITNVSRLSTRKKTSSSAFSKVSVHRRLKTISKSHTARVHTGSQSIDTNPNEAMPSLKMNSSSDDQYDTTQSLHKPKKKKKNFPWSCLISSVLILFALTALFLCVLLIKLNQTKKDELVKQSVLRWNTTGITIVGVSNVSGSDNTHLNYPWSFVFDNQDTLFIADRNNHRIQKYLKGSTSGTTVAGFGNGTSGSSLAALNNPSHVIVDDTENLYITDTGNFRVLSWPRNASSGTVVAGFGGTGSATNQLNTPYGIQLDKFTSTLYIGDYSNSRIVSYAKNAVFGTVVLGGQGAGVNRTQIKNPVNIYLDYISNSLLIANHGAHNIVRWVRTENQWTLVAGDINGTIGNTSVMLNRVTDMILDPMGNMYVADRDNHRIQLFMAGEYVGRTIAGVNGVRGINATLLALPRYVKLDSQLNLYVADTSNHRIQKFFRY